MWFFVIFEYFFTIVFQHEHVEGEFDCYVVVFSIDDRNTFDRGVDILYSLRHEKHIGSAMILVGNKSDLVRTRIIQPEGKYLLRE